MMLLRCIPVPGTTIPEPSPFVHVTEHAQPSPSSTEMWVVEPSREAMKRSRNPGEASPLRNSGVRSDWARSIAATSAAAPGAPAPRSSKASA